MTIVLKLTVNHQETSWQILKKLSACFLICCCSFFCHAQSTTAIQKNIEVRRKLLDAIPDTSRVNLLLALGRYCLSLPGEFTNDLDSAMLLKNQAETLSRKAKYTIGIGKCMELEGEIWQEKGEHDKSLSLLNNAISFFDENKLSAYKGEAYVGLAQHFGFEGADLDKRIAYFKLADACFEKINDKEQQAKALQNLGDYYQLKGNLDEALSELNKSLNLYNTVGYKDIQGVYNLLGYVYQKESKYMLAIKYGLLAVKTAEELHDSSPQICTIYHRLGITYYNTGKNDSALVYYQKALDIAKGFKDTSGIREISINRILALRRINKPQQSLEELKALVAGLHLADRGVEFRVGYLFAIVYMDLKQYANAEKYVDDLLLLQKKYSNNIRNGIYINKTAIRFFYETGKYEKVHDYLLKNDTLFSKTTNYKEKAENELYWSKTDSALGNFRSALQHFQGYKAFNDSMVNNNNSKQVAELQLQFDLDKKDQNIQLLTQQSNLQKKQINDETTIRYMAIASLVLLIIFSSLLFNRYRLKQRIGIKLEANQLKINNQNNQLRKLLGEKEWLLREIHHRVKNNLQIVISLLNTQSAYLENTEALSAIQNSQHRMHSMSLIHQKLYQSNNLASIEMLWYIRELVDYMRDSFGTDKQIEFVFDIDKVEMDVAQAVPLGLILNEAISNAIKYAFPENKHGKIELTLQSTKDGFYKLKIADNGIGFPKDYDPDANDSLGMELMKGLTGQLDGSFEVVDKNGLSINVTFKKAAILYDTNNNIALVAENITYDGKDIDS